MQEGTRDRSHMAPGKNLRKPLETNRTMWSELCINRTILAAVWIIGWGVEEARVGKSGNREAK